VAGVWGSIARALTNVDRIPVLTALQLAPLSVLLNTPAAPVPAYTVEEAFGSMARVRTPSARNPALTALQLSPPSVLLKTVAGVR